MDEQAADLIDIIPCGLLSFTDQGYIVRANKTVLRYLGYEAEEMNSKNIEAILTLASRIFFQTHFFPLVKLNGRAEEIFLSLVSKDKTEIPVLINAVSESKNASLVIHCVLIPISRRGQYEDQILMAKRTAEDALNKNEELVKAKLELELNKEDLDRKIARLEQMNQDLVQFNAVISHDLQEPLRKISLFADILFLDNKDTLSPKGSESIYKIKRACDRIRNIVFNLEKLVSLDAEKTKLALVDLNKVLFQAKSKISARLDNKPLTLHAEPFPEIEGYPDQLELLFYHLIENAMKFSHPGKDVVIGINASIIQHNSFKTFKNKFKYIDFVKITFSDNGTGFENQYREYIFLILKKLQQDQTGIGFGLAFCKRIVENHYGSISAESEKGKGATFTILLPLRHHG